MPASTCTTLYEPSATACSTHLLSSSEHFVEQLLVSMRAALAAATVAAGFGIVDQICADTHCALLAQGLWVLSVLGAQGAGV